jgi:outer membrane lipoprotein-sorting protein
MVFFALLLCMSAPAISVASASAAGQDQKTTKSGDNKPAPKPEKIDLNQKNFTAEQVVEGAIFVYGSRPLLEQIRRNGMERGRVCKPTCDLPGKTEEATYERRFVRGANAEKDKVRVDQKSPSVEYSLIYGDGRLWGIINGAAFTPRADTASTFLSQQLHGVDNLLRYKENGSTVTMLGREKHKGLDLYVLNLVDKDKTTTRYYISSKTLYVRWLEYEEPGGTAGPIKYVRSFFDYRYAQGTLVPYKTVLLEDGKQTQETKILNVTFGIKLDDALFKNPEA